VPSVPAKSSLASTDSDVAYMALISNFSKIQQRNQYNLRTLFVVKSTSESILLRCIALAGNWHPLAKVQGPPFIHKGFVHHYFILLCSILFFSIEMQDAIISIVVGPFYYISVLALLLTLVAHGCMGEGGSGFIALIC